MNGWRRWRVRCLIGAALVAGAVAPSYAAAPSAQPQPRVSYAMHSARINQIRATPDLGRLVSVSQDKTVRVWRMADLQLLRTIYVPSEAGEEGALRSLAITPDGREVIVAGWTGIAWSGKGQLYRFDLASGRLLQTVRDLPDIVEALSISRDGRRLAVGLGGKAGLRILELPSGRELVADTEYGERVSFTDFAADGTLATTAQDGCVRLYDPQGRLMFRAEYPVRANADGRACKGSELGGIRFSPDGKRLAFGLQDSVEMVVMDVASRQVQQVLKVDDPLQRSLCCMNWSADSQQLFMYGAHEGEGATPMYRVDLASRQTRRMDVGRQRFTNTVALPDGGLVFSTSAPSLARVNAKGKLVAEALPPNGDFRFAWDRFHLSADGLRITLPMRADGSDVRTLDVGARIEAAYRSVAPRDQAPAERPLRTGALAIAGDFSEFGYKQPVRIGAGTVALKPFQSVRSWALAPKAPLAALGTQWSVMVVDARGKPLWERDLPAPAYQVNVSADGRWVVAAVGDGSIRWYTLRDGTETLGAFLHNNGEDWVAWTADGYYKCSPHGDEYFGWLTNEGDSAAPAFVRAVQVERTLYRPDLVGQTLSARPAGTNPATSLAAQLKRFAPPHVTIESIKPGTAAGLLELAFSAESTGRPIRELGVYVDGIPVLRTAERQLAPSETLSVRRTLTVRANSAASLIRVEAETDGAIGLDETSPFAPPQLAPPGPGKLWIVAAGVSEFDSMVCRANRSCRVDLPSLPNTSNDVQSLVNEMSRQQGRAFSSVSAVALSARSAQAPTKAHVLARLRALEQARPEDTIIVFLASHGFAAPGAADYYFIPQDASQRDLALVTDPAPKRRIAEGDLPSLISGSELAGVLRRVPGRRILLLDTCYSGSADGRGDPYALSKRSAAAQVAVLSASRGDERSWEAFDAEHGAFTLAILQALRGGASRPGQSLTLRGAFDYAVPRVADNARRMSALSKAGEFPQTPTLVAPAALQATVIAIPGRD